MKPLLFAGPSITGVHVPATIENHPPAQCGDIYQAARLGRRVIGLLDGYFGWTRPVWHKEILWALSQGCHVIGAASMGALRAAELNRFGMQGVGGIFRDYLDGRLEDDDDVAVVHHTEENGFRQITEAMVDVEATVNACLLAGVLSPSLASRTVRAAKAVHFSQRTYASIVAHPSIVSLGEQTGQFLQRELVARRRSRKRDDAETLIIEMLRYTTSGSRFEKSNFKLEETSAFQAFREEQP